MPAAYQVFGPDGAVIVDSTKRLSQILAMVSIPAGAPGTSGSLTDAGLAGGEPFWFTLPSTGSYPTLYAVPAITVSGTTLTWTWGANASGGKALTLIYGVY